MGQMQDFGNGITLGGAGPFDQPLTMPDAVLPTPHIVSCIPTAASAVPAVDRFGFEPIAGPAVRLYAPALGGGLPFYYFGRYWHSAISPALQPAMPNGPRLFRASGTLGVGEELTLPHGLIAEDGLPSDPDGMIATPAQLPGANQDFAVTIVDDVDIRIKNYSGALTLDYLVKAWLVHSIQFNRPDGSANQTLFDLDVVLPTGGGPLVIPHDLVGVPDFISVFAFDVGGGGPACHQIIMPAPPDADNITLANGDAAQADATVKLYAQRTHGIQL